MSRRKFSPRGFSALVISLGILVGCGETGPSEQLPPAAITDVTGIPLVGPAGEPLAERVVVRVADAAGNPLPGVSVTFTTTGNGASVDPATTVTDDRGEARTRWTLGRTPGQQTLSVDAGGTTAQITATAGPPRIASLAVNAGNNQSGTAGSNLATNPSVIARDASNNPVEGVTVFFNVISGGGSVTQPSAVTNAQGIASAGSWRLGSASGTQLLSAQVPQVGVSNNPLVFTATATSGPPASVTALSATQQTALVGTLVSSAPSVVVRDAGGSPVANATVTFAVTSGGGQLTGASQTTNAQGVATVTSWRVGPSPGTNTVSASIAGVAGIQPVTFTATATAGAPATLETTLGENQTSPVNRPVPIAPQVRVRDAAGNGVSGVTVNFAIGVGGGSVVLSNVVTGSDGTATVGAWILGPASGPNTLIASVTGLPSVTFTATATGGTAVSMQPISQVTQSGTAGTQAASPPSVVVRDAQGNPVQGVTVTFNVTAGGGSLTGPSPITDINGIATVGSWTFGPAAGPNTVVASATSLPNVTFNATTTGVATQVTAFSATNPAAVQGTLVLPPPSVRVTDAGGQGVGQVPVTFAITGGGGSLTLASQLTDATGVATVGSWTLGNSLSNTMTATVGASVSGNPVTFTASAATKIVVTQQPSQAGLGTNFTVTVQLQDANSVASPVSGALLTISIASGGGTLNAAPNSALSLNSNLGTVSFIVNVTGGTGPRTLQVSGAGVGNTLTTPITIP